jgi:hypothetical protein
MDSNDEQQVFDPLPPQNKGKAKATNPWANFIQIYPGQQQVDLAVIMLSYFTNWIPIVCILLKPLSACCFCLSFGYALTLISCYTLP